MPPISVSNYFLPADNRTTSDESGKIAQRKASHMPHRRVMKEFRKEFKSPDGLSDVFIETKANWITSLQRGHTNLKEQRAIRDIFLSVDNQSDMVLLVKCIEMGSDQFDFEYLLEVDINDAVVRNSIFSHVRDLLPKMNIAWLGDNRQGDLQTALMAAVTPGTKDRVASFINLVEENDVKKIKSDILSVAELGYPLPKALIGLAKSRNVTLSQLTNALAELGIHMMKGWESFPQTFKDYQYATWGPWMLMSDVDETILTTHSNEPIPGHLEAIKTVNATNRFFNTYFMINTARPKAGERKVIRRLRKFAQENKLPGRYYTQFTVRNGRKRDLFALLQGKDRMAKRMAASKFDHLQGALYLWYGPCESDKNQKCLESGIRAMGTNFPWKTNHLSFGD